MRNDAAVTRENDGRAEFGRGAHACMSEIVSIGQTVRHERFDGRAQ